MMIGTLLFPIWSDNQSSDLAFQIVPNLLGFSIGAMAIVLAFPSTAVFDVLAEDGREDSYYMELAARLVHFVFIQALTLVAALLARAFPFFLLSYVSLVLLTYAILSAALTALALYELAMIYNASKKKKPDEGAS